MGAESSSNSSADPVTPVLILSIPELDMAIVFKINIGSDTIQVHVSCVLQFDSFSKNTMAFAPDLSHAKKDKVFLHLANSGNMEDGEGIFRHTLFP